MVQDLFKHVISKQVFVEKIIADSKIDDLDDSEIINLIKKYIDSGLAASTAVAKKIADYFQLLNRGDYFDHISLENIAEIYIQLIKVHPYDISLYEAAFYYFDSVMDDSDKANDILKTGILKIKDRVIKLQNLLD